MTFSLPQLRKDVVGPRLDAQKWVAVRVDIVRAKTPCMADQRPVAVVRQTRGTLPAKHHHNGRLPQILHFSSSMSSSSGVISVLLVDLSDEFRVGIYHRRQIRDSPGTGTKSHRIPSSLRSATIWRPCVPDERVAMTGRPSVLAVGHVDALPPAAYVPSPCRIRAKLGLSVPVQGRVEGHREYHRRSALLPAINRRSSDRDGGSSRRSWSPGWSCRKSGRPPGPRSPPGRPRPTA